MGRYSPTVLPDSGGGGFASSIMNGLTSFLQGRRQKRADDRADQTAELQDVAARGELHDQGYREGPAPVERPRMVFEGESMAAPEPSALSAGLREVGRRGRERPEQQQEPELLAHPGSFVPGMGFTTRALYAPPRYEQVTDNWYRDTEQTPDAMATRAAGAKRSGVATALEQIGRAKPGQGGAYADALEGGVPSSVLFDDQEEKPLTRAERRARLEASGKIPPELLDAAVDDPTVARSYLEQPDPETPRAWQPGSMEERVNLEEALAKIRNRNRAPTAAESERGRFTADQAMDQLRELYAVRNEIGEITGYSIDEQDLFDLASAMARGEDVELPPQPSDAGGGEQLEEDTVPVPGKVGALQRFLPGGASGFMPRPRPAAGAGAGAGRQLADEEIKRLLDAGYSIDEIIKRASSPGG